MLFSPVRVTTPHGPRRLRTTPLAILAALGTALCLASPLPASAQEPAPQAPAAQTPAKPAEAKKPEAKPAIAQVEPPEQFKAVRAKLDEAKAELDKREKELGHTDVAPPTSPRSANPSPP